jgi:hypothetical protein
VVDDFFETLIDATNQNPAAVLGTPNDMVLARIDDISI